jgi:hypothetical protein
VDPPVEMVYDPVEVVGLSEPPLAKAKPAVSARTETTHKSFFIINSL